MAIESHSVFTKDTDSFETGKTAGTTILEEMTQPPALVLTYLTDNHDQAAFLKGLRESLGEGVPIVGSSSQGVMGRGAVLEDGYVAGIMGLGGADLSVGHGAVESIQIDTFEKGAALGRAAMAGIEQEPKVAILHYDPLCNTDVDMLLKGFAGVVPCPTVGGASAHMYFYGELRKTFQYHGVNVLNQGAVAAVLAGGFTVETAICHGCSPVGIKMTVTQAEGNRLISLDGKSAVDVWEELCGSSDSPSNQTAALSVGIPIDQDAGINGYLIRAAYDVNREYGVVLGSAIPVGTKVMLYHRSVEDVLEGAIEMAHDLKRRLDGKTPRAVIGFECGARTKPFLGTSGTRDENEKVQAIVGKDAQWIGMMAWGELFPVGGKPGFHNYAFPLLVLAD